MGLLPDFSFPRLSNRPALVKIVSNMGWLFIDKALRMGVGLVVGVWIARYLGPEQFGHLNYAIAFVALFGAVATLGLSSIVVREIARDPDRADATLGTAFMLRLAGGLGAFVLVVATVVWVNPEDSLTKSMVAILGLSLVFKSSEVIKSWFESQVQSRYTVWVESTVFLLVAAGKVALILYDAPLIAFVWIALVEAVLVSIGLFGIYIKRNGSLRAWSVRLDRARTLLRDSWPLIFSGTVLMIQARIDQFMLKEMVGNSEVGQYSAAMRIVEVFGVVPVILRSSLYPMIAQSKQASGEKYSGILLDYYRLSFVLFLVVFFPLFFFSAELVQMLFGDDYRPAGVLLSVMSFRLFFTNMGIARGSYLLTENLMRFSLFTMVIGTATNVSLNYLLIPGYQGLGAIYASLTSFFVTVFFFDMFFSGTRKNAVAMCRAMISLHKIGSRK